MYLEEIFHFFQDYLELFWDTLCLNNNLFLCLLPVVLFKLLIRTNMLIRTHIHIHYGKVQITFDSVTCAFSVLFKANPTNRKYVTDRHLPFKYLSLALSLSCLTSLLYILIFITFDGVWHGLSVLCALCDVANWVIDVTRRHIILRPSIDLLRNTQLPLHSHTHSRHAPHSVLLTEPGADLFAWQILFLAMTHFYENNLVLLV